MRTQIRKVRMVLQSLPRWTDVVLWPLIAQGGNISAQYVIILSLIILLLILHLRRRDERLPLMEIFR